MQQEFTTSDIARFWAQVQASGPCRRWTGRHDRNGYGAFRANRRQYKAHRVAWYLAYGNWPDDETTDHLCRVRDCVEVAHLEPVSSAINTLRGMAPAAINARKTQCINGHAYDEANTRIYTGHHRRCRQCVAMYARQQRKRGAVFAPSGRELLPPDVVRAIRAEHATGASHRALAQKWGRSLWVIYGVVERRTYQHVV